MQPLIFPIFLDYKCNYACGHCSVGSSPRTKFPIDEELVFSYITQIAEFPTAAGVVFTGGEPTLRKDLLIRAIAFAQERGLMTRVVTNAWWARTRTKAETFVEDLRQAGLQELNTSWDGFHAEFGSLDNVANAIAAGLDAGMRVSVGIVEVEEGGSHKEALVGAVGERLGKTKEELRLLPLYVLVDFPAKVGTAESLDLSGVRAGERIYTGCTEVGTTLSLHPDGTVRGCCGTRTSTRRTSCSVTCGPRRSGTSSEARRATSSTGGCGPRARPEFSERWASTSATPPTSVRLVRRCSASIVTS